MSIFSRIYDFFTGKRKPEIRFQASEIKNSVTKTENITFTPYYLTNPNLFTTSFGLRIGVPSDYYKLAKEDEVIQSCIDQLKYKVASLKDSDELEACEIVGSGKARLQKQVDLYANRLYNTLNIEELKVKALNNVITGISVFQMQWKNEGNIDPDTGFIELERIIERNPDYFTFKYDENGDPKLYYQNINGGNPILLNEYEFINFPNGFSDTNPYGKSEINQAGATWYWIRKGINRYRYRTMERKGDPSLLLKHDMKSDTNPIQPGDVQTTVDGLQDSLGIGGVIYVPEGMAAEYLEVNMQNSFDYKQIWDDSQTALMMLILNATSTMYNSSSTGSYNQASVQQESFYSKIDTIAKGLENFINHKIIKTAIDINFPDVSFIKYPKYNITLTQEETQMDKEERETELNKSYIQMLIEKAPGKVPIKQVFEMFGIENEHINDKEYFGEFDNIMEENNTENEVIEDESNIEQIA